MAYNSSKGPQTHGDVKYEGDAEDTQIDFENDFVAIKTNGVQRLIINSNTVTSSVAISCSHGITASHFVGDGSGLTGLDVAVNTYSNAADNRILTSVDTTSINGEANLQFNGSVLAIVGSVTGSGAANFQSLAINGNRASIDANGAATVRELTASAGISAASVSGSGAGSFGTLNINNGVATINAAGALGVGTIASTAITATTVSGTYGYFKNDVTSSAAGKFATLDINNGAATVSAAGALVAGAATVSSVTSSGAGGFQSLAINGNRASIDSNGAATVRELTASAGIKAVTVSGSGQGSFENISIGGGTSTINNLGQIVAHSVTASSTGAFQSLAINGNRASIDANGKAIIRELTASSGILAVNVSGSGQGSFENLSVGGGRGAISNAGVVTVVSVTASAAGAFQTLAINGNRASIDANGALNVREITASSGISSSMAISASSYYGDGSTLTGLTPAAITTYSNATDNRIITSVNSTSVQGEANLTFDGTKLAITGGVGIDKNHTGTSAATIAGIEIDFDKVGASTSNNTMYGLNIDMDNTTATNGINTMYGIYATPTLTHAANAGECHLWGINIETTAGTTNGTSINTAGRLKATGGDINYGLFIDCGDDTNDVDFRIRSQADNADYFQIKTIANGATTISTVDGGASAAHLTCSVDGDILLDPVGGSVVVDGAISGSKSLYDLTNGTLQIGNEEVGTGIAVKISTTSDNSVPLLIKTPSHETILGVTGSGKVTVGGLLLNAKLNVTGSDSDMLFEAKSNTRDPVFRVEGNGQTLISGSLIVKNTMPSIYFSSSHSPGTPLGQIGMNSSDNILIQNDTINKHIVLKVNDNGTTREGLRVNGAVPEVVVNEGSDSLVDFRVESDSNTHMLFVDGGNEKVGINTSAPSETLSVVGSTHLSGSVRLHTALKTANYTLTTADRVVVFNASNGVTASLPTLVASNVGLTYTIKNIAPHMVQVSASNAQDDFIDGLTTHDLPAAGPGTGSFITVCAYAIGGGFDWAIISKN